MKTKTAIAIASLASLGSLEASILTYDDSFVDMQVTASAHSTGLTILGTFSDSDTQVVNLVLPKFDASLGTLNSVTFTIDLSTNSTDAAFTESGLGITLGAISLDRALSFTVSGLAGTLGSGTANLAGTPLASALGLSLGIGINTNGMLTDNTAVGDLSSGALTSGVQLAGVSGTGNLTLTLSATDLYQYTTILGTSATTWGGTTTYSGIGSVTYDYTPVPEPGTTALVAAAGALGLALIRRRRQG